MLLSFVAAVAACVGLKIFVGCRVTEVYWAAVYKAGVRLAAAFRRKRLLLVGDAAHLHPSILGQGMNLGMQVGWIQESFHSS